MQNAPNSINRPIAEDAPGPGPQHHLKQSLSTRRRYTTVGPEDNIVLVWIVTALEEVEEQMSSPTVDIASVRPTERISARLKCAGAVHTAYETLPSQNEDFLILTE